MTPKTSKEAYLLGEKFFFTGRPCIRGHIANRYESGGRCVECVKATITKRSPEKTRVYSARQRSKNPEAFRAKNAERTRRKHAESPIAAFIHSVRSNIGKAFIRKGWKKYSKTEALLSCSIAEFRAHIEKQFPQNMTWENRERWHLDHIVPIASAKTIEEVAALCHFTNLRPIWKEDNLRKSSKTTHLL